MNTLPSLPGKWYVTMPKESHDLVGPGAGPFDTERQARDWLLCLPLIKGAAVWRHSWPDRRAAVRHPAAAGTVCRLSHDRDADLVWNLSEGGAGLIVHEPLPAGTPIAAEIMHPAGGSRPVTGHIRHSARLRDNSYLVGCQFDQPLDPVPFLVGA